jgi:hypothetical protein
MPFLGPFIAGQGVQERSWLGGAPEQPDAKPAERHPVDDERRLTPGPKAMLPIRCSPPSMICQGKTWLDGRSKGGTCVRRGETFRAQWFVMFNGRFGARGWSTLRETSVLCA